MPRSASAAPTAAASPLLATCTLDGCRSPSRLATAPDHDLCAHSIHHLHRPGIACPMHPRAVYARVEACANCGYRPGEKAA